MIAIGAVAKIECPCHTDQGHAIGGAEPGSSRNTTFSYDAASPEAFAQAVPGVEDDLVYKIGLTNFLKANMDRCDAIIIIKLNPRPKSSASSKEDRRSILNIKL